MDLKNAPMISLVPALVLALIFAYATVLGKTGPFDLVIVCIVCGAAIALAVVDAMRRDFGPIDQHEEKHE